MQRSDFPPLDTNLFLVGTKPFSTHLGHLGTIFRLTNPVLLKITWIWGLYHQRSATSSGAVVASGARKNNRGLRRVMACSAQAAHDRITCRLLKRLRLNRFRGWDEEGIHRREQAFI